MHPRVYRGGRLHVVEVTLSSGFPVYLDQVSFSIVHFRYSPKADLLKGHYFKFYYPVKDMDKTYMLPR